MGSTISLSVGRFEIEWGKNSLFRSHAKLFLPGDLKPVAYYYAHDCGDGIRETKPAFRRTLQSVRKRLSLLGYSIARCQQIYEQNMAHAQTYEGVHPISWPDFVKTVCEIDLACADTSSLDDDCDPGEYAARHVLEGTPLEELAPTDWLSKRSLGLTLENLDPYVTLRILAEEPRNRRKSVIWRHADVLEGGWIEEADVTHSLSAEDRYLIVTEGSSDSAILRKSLDLLFPDVADFFDFIDMSEHYPFTGTGSLVNFCMGLARIGIQNKVLVVFDNDTAGREAMDRLKDVPLPEHMKLTTLPSMDRLRRFRTLGPTGSMCEDVNGTAASIELYLDLRYGGPKKPAVRWTSYSDRVGAYQGALVRKEEYARAFLKGASAKGYSLKGLRAIWTAL
ncbi:MAG: HEPN/Toprim-associated domain-containing protein, partial [Phycisphaerales bacterium]